MGIPTPDEDRDLESDPLEPPMLVVEQGSFKLVDNIFSSVQGGGT